MGWIFDRKLTNAERFAPDMLDDPAMVRIDKLFGLWTAVTLLAHSARKPGFVAVAEARTDTGGKFTFPAQAPVASTSVGASPERTSTVFPESRPIWIGR